MFACHLVFGLKTLTSKNAIWPACQNPQALISSLTSLPAAAECWRYSPVICWSCSSTCTSLQNSFNSIDVIFLMWLCRKETKPPFCRKGHAGRWWWWWIVFVVWLTDERRLALFPARTIVRDPHHHESPTRRELGLNLHRTWVQAWLNKVVQ